MIFKGTPSRVRLVDFDDDDWRFGDSLKWTEWISGDGSGRIDGADFNFGERWRVGMDSTKEERVADNSDGGK